MSITADLTISQFKVLLLGISPMIWRCLLVRSDSTIADLHHIAQSPWGGRILTSTIFVAAESDASDDHVAERHNLQY